ncbi:hypothetical protein BMS3Abin09_00207 [bacterium BMS3Abin09]|nr:hypothetical protein BMS3Abin09_00207 [bacterium BMS3Abin09]
MFTNIQFDPAAEARHPFARGSPHDIEQPHAALCPGRKPGTAAKAKITAAARDKILYCPDPGLTELLTLIRRPPSRYKEHPVTGESASLYLLSRDKIERKPESLQRLMRHKAPEERFVPEEGDTPPSPPLIKGGIGG